MAIEISGKNVKSDEWLIDSDENYLAAHLAAAKLVANEDFVAHYEMELKELKESCHALPNNYP